MGGKSRARLDTVIRGQTGVEAAVEVVVVVVEDAVVEADAQVLCFVVLVHEGVRLIGSAGEGDGGGACKCGEERRHARDRSGWRPGEGEEGEGAWGCGG